MTCGYKTDLAYRWALARSIRTAIARGGMWKTAEMTSTGNSAQRRAVFLKLDQRENILFCFQRIFTWIFA